MLRLCLSIQELVKRKDEAYLITLYSTDGETKGMYMNEKGEKKDEKGD